FGAIRGSESCTGATFYMEVDHGFQWQTFLVQRGGGSRDRNIARDCVYDGLVWDARAATSTAESITGPAYRRLPLLQSPRENRGGFRGCRPAFLPLSRPQRGGLKGEPPGS